MEVSSASSPSEGQSRRNAEGKRRCEFFIKRKQRQCRWPVMPLKHFCVHHLPQDELERKRVLCPLNPSHRVLLDRLQEHLKVCNVYKERLRVRSLPYFCESINVNMDLVGDDDAKMMHIDDFQDAERIRIVETLPFLIKKIKNGPLSGLNVCEDVLEESALGTKGQEERLSKMQRHHVQESAIIDCFCGALGKQKLSDRNAKVLLVEMGAGRGGLSHAACDYFSKKQGADLSCLLIDRKACANKSDNALRCRQHERSRIDIRDLDLRKHSFLNEHLAEEAMIAMGSKHLCGAATCLSLSCALNRGEGQKVFDVIAIALCCHHLCTWQSYANREMFLNDLGLRRRDFELIRCMSSWAISGSDEKIDRFGGRSLTEVGRQCKHLLNLGRVLYLHKHGYRAKLLAFISTAVTKENVVLLAKKN